MGRVFSWNEIVDDCVPVVESFSTVADKVKERLRHTPGVKGAVLCGSVLQENHNERSDVDVVVLYDQIKRGQLSEAVEDIYYFARKFHVPVEIHPIDTETAKTPIHHVDLS